MTEHFESNKKNIEPDESEIYVESEEEKNLRGEMLTLYQSILRGKEVRDDEYSVIKSHLKLSGIVHEVNGLLKVRNPIYATVFSEKWIDEHLPDAWVKLQYRNLRRNAVVALSVLVIILLATTVYALYQGNVAVESQKKAEDALNETTKQKQIAEDNLAETGRQKKFAEDNLAEADKQRKIAEDNLAEADKQKKIADERLVELNQTLESLQQKEKEARNLAEKEREARQDAETQKQKAEDNEKQAVAAKNEALEAKIQVERAKAETDFREETEKLHRDVSYSTNPDFAETKLDNIIRRYEVEMPRLNMELKDTDLQGKADAYYKLATVYQSLNKPSSVTIKKYEEAAQYYAAIDDSYGQAKAIVGAGSFLAQNDVQGAIKYYKDKMKSLEGEGGKADLQIELANILFKQGLYDEALENCKEALKQYSDSKEKRFEGETLELIVKINEGRAFKQLSDLRFQSRTDEIKDEPDITELIQAYENLLNFYTAEKNNSGLADTLSKLGNTLALLPSKREQGIKYLLQAQEKYETVQNKAKVLQILEALAEISANAGNRQKAIEYRDKAFVISQEMANEPAADRVALKLLNDYSGLADKQETLRLLKEKLFNFEQHNKYDLQAAAWEKIGSVYLGLNEKQNAIDSFNTAIGIYQKNQPNQIQEARILRMIAKAYNQAGDKENAIAYYKKSRDIYLTLEKSNLYTYRLQATRLTSVIGEIYYSSGKKREALEAFQEAYNFNLQPDAYGDLDVAVSILQTARELKKEPEAVKFFDAALEKVDVKKKRNALTSLSYACWVIGRPDIGIEYLDKGLALFPLENIESDDSNSTYIFTLAQGYLALGKKEKSVEIANKLYNFYRQKNFEKISVSKLNSLANFLNYLGDRKRASELYQLTELASYDEDPDTGL